MSARAAKATAPGDAAPSKGGRARKAVPAPGSPEPEAQDCAHDETHEHGVQEARFATLDRIVLFSVEDQRYGLPIAVVQEIQQMVALSEIPDDSGAVVGVINVRGTVVPVMDLRRMLGMPQRAYGLQTPMVFVRTPRGAVALVVDDVEDVVEVPPSSMQAPSEVFALSDRLIGVCRLDSGPVFVLDIERLVPAGRGGHS